MKKVIFFTVLLAIASCVPEPPMLKKDFLDLTVILDLSDRIKAEHQREKDQLIISELLNAFEERQRKFGFQISKDRFTVAVVDQKDADVNLFKLGESLHIDMAQRGMNKSEFDTTKQRFLAALDTLYHAAAEGPTTGADIWTFFRDKLPVHLSASSPTDHFRNQLVILSDGYLRFDRDISDKRPAGTYMKSLAVLRNRPDWEQVFEQQHWCMQASRLPDTTEIGILMLEVRPEAPEVNTNEMDILRKFWGCWFESMGMDYRIYAREENPANLKALVQDYLKID